MATPVMTRAVVGGRLVWQYLDPATWQPAAPVFPLPPARGPLDYPPGLGPSLGLVQGMTDGSEVVRPLASFNNPQGLTDDTPIIQDSITRTGGQTRLTAGVYQIQTGGLLLLGPGQWLTGEGIAETLLNFTGSGDCIRQVWTGAYGSIAPAGGGVAGMRIDGAGHAAGASAALHAGDIRSLIYDSLYLTNFSGPGDIAAHFDNQYNFTERMSARLEIVNCTQAVVLDVTPNTGPSPDSSTPSFARCEVEALITTFALTQQGVILQNGAALYDGRLTILGNFTGAAAGAPGAVLTITGTVPAGHPGAGAGSRIEFGHVDIGAESTAGAVTPQTISFGAASNIIVDTQGVLDFGAVNAAVFTRSNLAAAGATFRHNGTILGDPSLPATVQYGTHTVGAPLGNGSTIFANQGGNVAVSTAAAVSSIILAPGSRDGQQLTVVNTSANTITFDVAAVSHVASGASAVIAAAAGAVFIWNAAQALWYHAGAGA